MKTNKGISCPSCGRFVGAHDRCPYCGTGLQKRVSLKSLRYISLIVAIVGLVCLQLMAMSRETPAKEISSITPAMNFAYIKVKGIATRPMKYYRTGDKVSSCYIYLKDKTGMDSVKKAYPTARILLVGKNGIPWQDFLTINPASLFG